MSDAIVLADIPFRVDMSDLRRRLHVVEGSGHDDELRELAAQAEAVARPKALFKVAYIEERDDESVVIDGVRFTSRVLRVNLDKAHRVFPYVITCGMELHEWESGLEDFLHRYWADAIKAMALYAAVRYCDSYIVKAFHPGKTARMSPGSLADWPLKEQRPLFRLLGDPEAAIGVQLTDSFLMVPNKSVSGIRFPTEESFESCQLCPREGCPGRRAPYDRELYERRYKPR